MNLLYFLSKHTHIIEYEVVVHLHIDLYSESQKRYI